MNLLRRLLCLTGLALTTAGAHAGVLYSNDFSDTSVGMANWSSPSALVFSTPPNAGAAGIGQFLGEYGDTQSVRFSLSDARLRNATVTLTLDFLAIRSWDGQDPTWGGPDRFTITANGETLLDRSFSNGAGLQTYTVDALAPAGDGSNDFPMAGSRAQYALGYSFYDGINEAIYNPQDAVYGMLFRIRVGNTDTISLVFAGAGLQETWIDNDPRGGSNYRDESWGIDNFAIAIPAPGTLATLLAGLFGFLGVTRRRVS